MNKFNLITLIFILMITVLGRAEGPGSTSGGNQCIQFVSGILEILKDSFKSKDFNFLSEAEYEKILTDLNKVRISRKLFDLKSTKSRDMEVVIAKQLIRVDTNYCNKENSSYSPGPTFNLLFHEVLSLFFQNKESGYQISSSSKNYLQVLDVARKRVGRLTIAYSLEEHLLMKKIISDLENENSDLVKTLRSIYNQEINISVKSFEEALQEKDINITSINRSFKQTFGFPKKLKKLCQDGSDDEKCKDNYFLINTTKVEFIVTIGLSESWYESMNIHETQIINRVAFRFNFIEKSKTQYISNRDDAFSETSYPSKISIQNLGRIK